MNRLLAILLLLALHGCEECPAQTLSAVWTAPSNFPAATYRIGIGTNSGLYQTVQTVTGTNGVINVSTLFPGTNYLAVEVATNLGGTNGIYSVWSSEVILVRIAAPPLRLAVSLDTSTNLTVWSGAGQTADAIVSADKSIEFFRPHNAILQTAAGTPDETQTPAPAP